MACDLLHIGVWRKHSERPEADRGATVFTARSSIPSPNGAPEDSPGQRPGAGGPPDPPGALIGRNQQVEKAPASDATAVRVFPAGASSGISGSDAEWL
jgi:hypothetical protein